MHSQLESAATSRSTRSAPAKLHKHLLHSLNRVSLRGNTRHNPQSQPAFLALPSSELQRPNHNETVCTLSTSQQQRYGNGKPIPDRPLCSPALIASGSLHRPAVDLPVDPGLNVRFCRKPKNADSFLYPFTEEMLELTIGVQAFHILYRLPFILRAFLILLGGDMPAMAMILLMKGHNGICPCRMCKILGVRKPNGKTYYVPLTPPKSLQATHPTHTPASIDTLLRTKEGFLEDGRKVESAATDAEAKELAKASGVKGVPILSHIPSLILPFAVQFDFMHLMFENTFDNVLNFMCGKFKDLDHEGQGYRINPTVWEAIGKATAASGSTIPGAYGARPRDFTEDRTGITADMLSFWVLFLGPIYLERAFDNREFYQHFIRLVKLVNLCLQFEITREQIQEIREGFAAWVVEYERLYYQYKDERISACPLTIHALLHIADGIEFMGPVWVYWAFGMERYCGKLARMIKSRRFPFANLDNQVLTQSQLQCIASHHNIHQEIALRPPPESDAGTIIVGPEYPDCRLLTPARAFDLSAPANSALKKLIAASLVTRFCTLQGDIVLSRANALKLLDKTEAIVYGRLKKTDGGDIMFASKVAISNMEDRRDATFVRYECLVDKNQRNRRAAADYRAETNYGQLQYIFLLKIPPYRDVKELRRGCTLALGAIQKCNITRHHPMGLDTHYYRTMSPTLEIVDINFIQCLVARTKWEQEWAIFDRSGASARAFDDD
ncbi:hypothetical protein NMY22_g10485 [Coprinellus aureogranulatus]|nr:hypothetical protein NMY22_g10485 [Coprinellus aureogranulatus]